MKKEAFDLFKREMKYLGIALAALFIALEIAFYKENLLAVLRNALSLFWLFVLPGYFIMLYWHENLGFLERFFVGFAVAAGITGVFSYYAGLIGLNIKYHVILFPIVMILVGAWVNLKELKKDSIY